MTLLDVEDYIKTKEGVLADYEDRKTWAKKALVNISKAGFFSSDRTIAEYNKDIWRLNLVYFTAGDGGVRHLRPLLI